MNYNPENPCQELNNKNRIDVEKLLELETTHMLPDRYNPDNADTAVQRSNACNAIKQYGDTCKCHPVVPFLAISYYDNVISAHDIPVIIDGDIFKNRGLFYMGCFFSAWKMTYRDECLENRHIKLSYLITDLHAMEREIDRCLENRHCKRPITSLAFPDYFISLLVDVDNSRKTDVALIKNFATHRAYAQQYNMKYTKYKPSVLAATAILYSCRKLYKRRYGKLEALIFKSSYLDTASLKRALRVQKPPPRVGKIIKPATFKKIRVLLEGLPIDFWSSSIPSVNTSPPNKRRFARGMSLNFRSSSSLNSSELPPTKRRCVRGLSNDFPSCSSGKSSSSELPPQKRRCVRGLSNDFTSSSSPSPSLNSSELPPNERGSDS